MDMYQITPGKLKDFIKGLFAAYGFRADHAESIANNLVGSDVRGIHSHGVVRVELYLRQQRMGAIRGDAEPAILRETPVSAVIDADKAAGAAAGDLAVELALKKAGECGFGMAAVRNSNHFGSCGYYTEKIAAAGMIGAAATNTGPLMASPVTKRPVIGNNPFSIAVPAGRYGAINLDISNGVMAFGKIFEYQRQNKPFPRDAWLDKEGNPTTDPFANELIQFISLPIAGHKGYGLAVMVECLTSILSGGAVAGDILPPPGRSQDENNPVSHMVMAIDPKCFGAEGEIEKRGEQLVEYLHSFETREKDMKMYYPGELERIAAADAEKNGVVLPENVCRELREIAEKIGFPFPEEAFVKASGLA